MRGVWSNRAWAQSVARRSASIAALAPGFIVRSQSIALPRQKTRRTARPRYRDDMARPLALSAAGLRHKTHDLVRRGVEIMVLRL